MSYDLTFIKYQKKPRIAVKKIYESLMNGDDVKGLEEIPLSEVKEDILECFSDWNVTDGDILDFEKGEDAFQVTFDPLYVRVDCYGKRYTYDKVLIKLLSGKYGFHMYDAQLNVLREVIGGKTALDRLREVKELLSESLEKEGYIKIASSFRFERKTKEAIMSVEFLLYEQNHEDIVNVRPSFLIKYPALDMLAKDIRGKAWDNTGNSPTTFFAITDASNKEVKDPCYFLKNGSDPKVLVDQIMLDIEKYVFPIFNRADSILKYEEVFMDKTVKSIRPSVYLRPYYQIAMALLNHGTIDEKKLANYIRKAIDEDMEFDASGLGVIRDYQAPKIENSTKEERYSFIKDHYFCVEQCQKCGLCNQLKVSNPESAFEDYINGQKQFIEVVEGYRK